jgi:hypothetical protein
MSRRVDDIDVVCKDMRKANYEDIEREISMQHNRKKNVFFDALVRGDIPLSFDSRTRWPLCEIYTSMVTDQGMCGTCWAFSVSFCVASRMCIQNSNLTNAIPSPLSTLECMKDCGDCYGGSVLCVLMDWNEFGILSDQVEINTDKHLSRHDCDQKRIPLNIIKVSSMEIFSTGEIVDLAKNIMIGGPCIANMEKIPEMSKEIVDKNQTIPIKPETMTKIGSVSDDVKKYNKYQSHFVRIIGWDTIVRSCTDTEYMRSYDIVVPRWILANTWGKDWGDDGMFAVTIGINFANIERNVVCPIISIT